MVDDEAKTERSPPGSSPEENRGAVRVLLVDDHTLFRQSLVGMLASHGAGGIEVVGQANNDAEAVGRLAEETCPDVLIAQVDLPLENSRKTLERLRALSSPPKWIVLTMFDDPRLVRELLGLGASALVHKSATVEELIGAIRSAALDRRGEEHVILAMPRRALEAPKEGPNGALTGRETQIVLLAARGMSNRQIAASLRISEATVKRHLYNAYRKLGVASRTEAAKTAFLSEWLTIELLTPHQPPGRKRT